MEVWYDLISQHGYLLIFFYLALGIIGVPIPLPDEIVVTYAGYLSSIGAMSFSLTFIVALIGAICGITFSYWLGKRLGEPFLNKYGPSLLIKEKQVQKARSLFEKYGSSLLLICYFIPGVRHVVAYLAGVMQFDRKKFVLFAYFGAVVWVLSFLSIGRHLGTNWTTLMMFMQKYTQRLIFILLLSGISVVIYYFWRKGRKSSC